MEKASKGGLTRECQRDIVATEVKVMGEKDHTFMILLYWIIKITAGYCSGV